MANISIALIEPDDKLSLACTRDYHKMAMVTHDSRTQMLFNSRACACAPWRYVRIMWKMQNVYQLVEMHGVRFW